MRSCLQELLLVANGRGIIAGGGPNPCGALPGNDYLEQQFLKNIYARRQRVLGQIIFQAKDSVIRRYTRDTDYGPAVLYTLFGDPALRLKYPQSQLEETLRRASQAPVEISPNPFSSSTVIKGKAKLIIYDACGDKVNEIAVNGFCRWRRNDGKGRILPAGIYFVRSAEGASATKAVIVQ